MEKKKIGAFISEAGNSAKNILGKSKDLAVKAIDQNDDGKFDLSDVSIVADNVGNVVKKTAIAAKEAADENKKRMDLKSLQPIFPDTLEQTDFFMSKLIRLVNRDKKHTESSACEGSIGYLAVKGGLRVVNLFKDSLAEYGLVFYPDEESEFYYVNPVNRDKYIALDDYFNYLKNARINELQRVAQDLGAKHFKVTYKEERVSFSEMKAKAQAGVGKLGDAKGEMEKEEKKFSMIDVAAEMNMDGHDPKEPKLVYLAKDDNVKNLIHLRMTGGESFHNHRISIKMSNSSGIKQSEAVKIDAVLKGMKVAGNATVASEAQNESRRYLEYEIDF